MTIDEFLEKVETELDDMEPKPGKLQPSNKIREIVGWSSMHALILIALIDTEYNVIVSGEDLRNCDTLEDIFNLIQSRK